MSKTPWMVRTVQMAAVLFTLLGCFLVVLYSPFYSSWVVKGLNAYVPVEVDEVAAQSQQRAALSDHETLEPGSDLWIARQAYLKVMQNDIQHQHSENLVLIQARYQLLKHLIAEEQQQEQLKKQQEQQAKVPLLMSNDAEFSASEVVENTVHELFDWDREQETEKMEQYLDFLESYALAKVEASAPLTDEQQEISKELEYLQAQSAKQSDPAQPYAIVVLGGGLTLADNGQDIVVNSYTRLRLEKTLEVHKQYQLPIVLSGVEAPYMQRWLQERGVDAKLLEDRSMNTCENTRFSSLLLQKKGGAPTVMLITDRYHMPRTRRLFALNGIETIAVEAPMPSTLTAWRPSVQNYDHSRRANYEMLATMRDMWFGSSDCREVP